MDGKTYHVKIAGQVQGVAFRHYTKLHADSTGISGWVRNCLDGSVETVISGSPEQLDEMVSWLHTGSPAAVVTNVTVTETQQNTLAGSFEIRY